MLNAQRRRTKASDDDYSMKVFKLKSSMSTKYIDTDDDSDDDDDNNDEL